MPSPAKTARNTKYVTVIGTKDSHTVNGPQGQQLTPTVSTSQCGSSGISACVVHMPAAKSSKPHYHESNEIIVVCIEGYAATLVGPELKPVFHGPGEFLYVPEGIIHAAVNLSPTNRLIAFETRTDPHFNDDVITLSELEPAVATVAADLQRRFAAGTLGVPPHWRTDDFSQYNHRVQ